MAYGTRWQIDATQAQTGQACTTYIKERDYTGSVTTLTTGTLPVEISYTPIGKYGASPWWNLASSTCKVEFYDDETGLLSDILSGDDEQFQLVHDVASSNEWTGFISPDSYRYKYYQKGIHSVSATDRIDALYKVAYIKAGNEPYTGRATLLEVLTRCLDSTGTSLGLATHMNWYPHFGANELSASDDMMTKARVDQDEFFDEDGNPYSKGLVLEQVLMRFQLQAFQAEGRWFFLQRKRNVIEVSGSNVFTCFMYDSTGAAESPATANFDAYKPASYSSSTDNQLILTSVTGTIPIGKAAITYYHGNPFTNLMDNLSFEEGLRDSIDGTPLVDGVQTTGFELDIDGLPSGEAVYEGVTFNIDGDDTLYTISESVNATIGGNATIKFDPQMLTVPADNAALTFYEQRGGWLRSTANFTTVVQGQGTTESDTNALQIPVDYETAGGLVYNETLTQESKGDIAGGTGLRLKTGWWVKVAGLSNVTTGFKHAFKLFITGSSTTWYYRHSDTTWQTTDTLNEIELITFSPAPENWFEIPIISAELLDGSTPMTGRLTIIFYEGKEIDPGSGTQQVFEYLLDNVADPQIILADGTSANEATQTLLTYTGNVNLFEPDTPTLIMGDGPTAGHTSRITAYDSTGAEQDLTANWSFLPTVANSGFSIDQLAANQWLREFGRSCRLLNGSLYSKETADPAKPYHMLQMGNPNSDTSSTFGWMSNLTYRPATSKALLTGAFVQVQETVTADQLCTVDIKPDTGLLSGINLNTGIVCGDTVDFTPNVPPTNVYFARLTQYRKVPILESGTWSSDKIVDVASGREISAIKVDESSGYIFGIEYDTSDAALKYLMRYNVDGTGEQTLYTYSLAGVWTTIGLAIGRISKTIYLLDRRTDTNGYRVRSVDYDGADVNALIYNEPNTSISAQGIGISSDEKYLFFGETAGTDDLIRLELANSATTSMGVPTNGVDFGNTHPDTYVIDSDYSEGIFTNVNGIITRWNYPGGGGETEVTALPTEGALGIDRANQQLYYVNGATDDRLRRISYDGTGDEEVLDHDQRIMSIDLGFN